MVEQQSEKEPTAVPGSPEQIEAIIRWAEYYGPRRYKALGEDYHEPDYLSGVMTALMALGANNKIPALWVINPLTGRGVFRPDRPSPPDDEPEPTIEYHCSYCRSFITEGPRITVDGSPVCARCINEVLEQYPPNFKPDRYGDTSDTDCPHCGAPWQGPHAPGCPGLYE